MATAKHPGSEREELSHGKERAGLNKPTTKGHKHHSSWLPVWRMGILMAHFGFKLLPYP